MPLTAPNLDDRRFQDLVDEAKKRIPQYNKDWTDHNVSDPGVTLIELFAWMTDLILYRLNRVPDLHYIKFMEMLGISLKGPQPAQVPITFWLSAPQSNPTTIPAGTEVSSTQTETVSPIVFSTDQDLRVQPPKLQKVISRVAAGSGDKKSLIEQNLRRLDAGFEGFNIFSDVPQNDDALYFGFENDLSFHILGFDMDFDPAGGAGIDPTIPPYIWEASTGKRDVHWERCEVEMDSTKGMNSAGRIQIHLPQIGKYQLSDEEMYWVRVKIEPLSSQQKVDGARPYKLSPRMRKLSAASWGGTVMGTHAQTISKEFVGQSDGTPGQRFFMKYKPVLDRKPDEHLVVQAEGQPAVDWNETSDFADSWASNTHYTLDSVTGELRFGPAVRQRDGTIKLYGAIPPRSANLVFNSYRYGGGQEGNVQKGILNTLKTAIPFVSQVSNRFDAEGGLDAESLESAMMRVPALLRSRERAVTESDFEFLAYQALPAAIGRVKCLQPTPAEAGQVIPGQIYLLVIPRVNNPRGHLEAEQLKLDDEKVKALADFINERRLLTTKVDIRPPAYQWVTARVKLRATPGASQSEVEQEVLSRLYQYLNPLSGGPEGKGWPFGRDLFASDVYQCLQGIPNVQFIRSLDMYTARTNGEPYGDPIETLEVVAHGVIASGRHAVEFV
jgi:predicted phage baseplate assembly protein